MPAEKDRLVYVSESIIHGKGLFAAKKIKKNTVIGICDTKKTKKKEGPYVLWTDDDGKKRCEVTCELKYINHSKEPNVVYYDDLSVVALRRIKADEELVHDYGEEWV